MKKKWIKGVNFEQKNKKCSRKEDYKADMQAKFGRNGHKNHFWYQTQLERSFLFCRETCIFQIL